MRLHGRLTGGRNAGRKGVGDGKGHEGGDGSGGRGELVPAGGRLPVPVRAPEGRRPLMRGSYGADVVSPELTGRQLKRMDRMGAVEFGRRRGPFVDRRIRKAVKRTGRLAARRRERVERALKDAERRAAAEARRSDERPTPGPRMLFGWGTGFAGPDRLMLPWHSTGVAQTAVLDPFLFSGRPPVDGPLVGVDNSSGVEWRFDPWMAYRAGLVTQPNMMIAGPMGTGKSMCLKTWSSRETMAPWNRRIIVEGDPKGEWARLAEALGGRVVHAGGGSIINLLDFGDRPAGMDEDRWQADMLVRRIDALDSLTAPVRAERPSLDQRERALARAALQELTGRRAAPTLKGMLRLLESDWTGGIRVAGLDDEALDEAARGLILILDEFVTGPHRGAFEDESTVDIDPASPMIVFDTGAIQQGMETRKAVWTAAMNSAIERLVSRHHEDGLFRIVIAEEGHQVLRNPALVRSWDQRMRLCGDLGVCNCMLVHELQDLEKYADQGTSQRKLIESILTMTSVKILYRQSPAALDVTGRLLGDLTAAERALLARLPQGVGLWRVGSTVRAAVHPMMGPEAYELMSQDEGRMG